MWSGIIVGVFVKAEPVIYDPCLHTCGSKGPASWQRSFGQCLFGHTVFLALPVIPVLELRKPS